MSSPKVFTVAEANACVPRLALLVERLQAAARRLENERAAAAAESGDDPSLETVVRMRPVARLLVEEIDGVVQDIEALGGHLKDVRLGLVDLAGRIEPAGEVVFLCWQLGEPEIGFWHPTSEGFAGRRPLPGASRPRWLQ